jgi:hypothetical protein
MKSIDQDEQIVLAVCGCPLMEYRDQIPYDEPGEYSEEIKKGSYEFLSGVVPDLWGPRVQFLDGERHYHPLSVKHISILQYLDVAEKYYLILRYEHHSDECANIYPLVKARKTGNACVAFEHRIKKGILIVLPGYEREKANDACLLLIKICKNYYKVREEYDDIKLNVDVPQSVRDSYVEALLCYLNDLHNASCVLSGRTLEATLKMIGAKGNTLDRKIKFLVEKHLLFNKTEELAKQIRVNRNRGAHFPDILEAPPGVSLFAEENNARNVLLFLRQFLTDITPLEATKQRIEDLVNQK